MEGNRTSKSLENKIGNLINVNARDSSVYTNISRHHLDISKYVNFDEINNFFNNNISMITINLNSASEELIERLWQTGNYDDFKKIIDDESVYLPVSRMRLLKSDFEYYKSITIEYIENYHSDFSSRLTMIERNAKRIKNDKGTWNLYLTRYFLTGVTNNATSGKAVCVRAPLLFYRINVVYDDRNGIIQLCKDGDDFILNEKLIIYLLRAAKKENILMNQFNDVNSLDGLISKIKDVIEFDIKVNEKQNDLSFKSLKLSDIPTIYDGLYLEDGLTYGIYDPTGGRLKQDLEMIIKLNKHKDVFDSNEGIPNELIQEEELQDEPLIQIGKLDIYQKFAVRSAIKQNTIIHGPPGTGKSEVISNIIANVLLRDKSVVMISEKKAALDVLHKRLKKLSVFMLQMYGDSKKDDFYNSILELDRLIGRDWEYGYSIKNIDRVVDREHYQNNKSLNKSLLNKIDLIIKLENFKYEGYDYIRLTKEIIDVWGNLETFKKIIDDGIMEYFEELKQISNYDTKMFANAMNEYSKYLVKYKLTNEDDFNEFIWQINNFLKYMNEFEFDINDVDRISKIKVCSTKLKGFLSDNIYIEKILKENPYSVYNSIDSINVAKRKLNGIVNINFFNNINNIHNKVEAFLNAIQHIKQSSVKYVFDQFVYKDRFVTEKPFSKLFYKRKLSPNDKNIIEYLHNINNTKISSINTFENLYNNSIYFEPLVVIYHFNKKIFDDKYINFINNKFYNFGYQLYLIQKFYNFDEIKIRTTKKLIDIYNAFYNEFPEIHEYTLLNLTIENFKNISWDAFGEYIIDEVKCTLSNKLANLNREDKRIISDAIRVAGLKRRPPIYKYLENYKYALRFFFPIWVSKPEQISLYSPLKENFFDYGIYDEASQMFLERAYPLLYRSKINIVAGDEHQLKPSSFFMSRDESRDDEDDEEMTDFDKQDSLLDRAMSTTWNNVILKNHYRSEKKELIEFSNIHIYSNELNYASMNSENSVNGLEVVNVKGYFDKYNQEEADKVIELVEQNVKKYDSILIITSNMEQAQLISNMIYSKEINNKKISEMINNNKLEIINIENVQGNEADLVIFSVTYAKKDEKSKLTSRFGPLISQGGKNRLNVAITRGKKKMIVVKSMYASEMTITNSNNKNLVTFRNFIEFCDLNDERIKEKNKMKATNKNSDFLEFDSDFEQNVYETLEPIVLKNNLKIETQYKVGSKSIDIVVINPEDETVLLGIEVDGWKYHSKSIKMLEDLYRQQFLESRGYTIFRVLEFEWKYNRYAVIKEICILLGIDYPID